MNEKLRKKIESRKAKAINITNRDSRTARIQKEQRIERASYLVANYQKFGDRDYSIEEVYEFLRQTLANYQLIDTFMYLLRDYSRKGIRDIRDIVSLEDIKEAHNRKIINEVHES
jgi:hypothetical protein